MQIRHGWGYTKEQAEKTAAMLAEGGYWSEVQVNEI